MKDLIAFDPTKAELHYTFINAFEDSYFQVGENLTYLRSTWQLLEYVLKLNVCANFSTKFQKPSRILQGFNMLKVIVLTSFPCSNRTLKVHVKKRQSKNFEETVHISLPNVLKYTEPCYSFTNNKTEYSTLNY